MSQESAALTYLELLELQVQQQEARSPWKNAAPPPYVLDWLRDDLGESPIEGPQEHAFVLVDAKLNYSRYAEFYKTGWPAELAHIREKLEGTIAQRNRIEEEQAKEDGRAPKVLTFDSLKSLKVWNIVFGKGSGKDWMCSRFVMYAARWLMSLKDPQGYFHLGQGSEIRIVNVATNADQAGSTFFTYLKTGLAASKFFQKLDQRPKPDGWPAEGYYELDDTIEFAHYVVARSGHSKADGLEGGNVFAAILDEADGFEQMEKAWKLYNALRSSSSTRFGSDGLVMLIHFPRSAQGIAMTMHKQAATDKTMLSMKHGGLEVRPLHTRRDPEGDMTEMESMRRQDPAFAAAIYDCNPQKAGTPWYALQGRIRECSIRPQAAQVESYVRKNKAGKFGVCLRLVSLQLDPQYRYFIGGDAGETGDAFCLSLMHLEPQVVVEYEEGVGAKDVIKFLPKEDLALQWIPLQPNDDYPTGVPVDYVNVEEVIEGILDVTAVEEAEFDKFASQSIVAKMAERGVDAASVSASTLHQTECHTTLRNLVQMNQIDLVASEWGIIELENLGKRANGRIDHPKNLRLKDPETGMERKVGNDLAAARAIAAHLAMSAAGNGAFVGEMIGAEVVQNIYRRR